MKTDVVPVAPVTRDRGVRRTLSAYARLSNVKVYFQYVGALVAWSLLPNPLERSSRALLALALFVSGVVSTAASAGALDDVQGLRDGLDRRTYARHHELRGVLEKPLVRGEIGERAAYRFALITGGLGLVLGVAALRVAEHRPTWLLGCWLVAWYMATQYSFGIKLSYRGAGELLLAVEAVAVTLIPLVFLNGQVGARAVFEAYLLGTMFAQVTVFSSSEDAVIDREFERMTIAARLSPRANRRFIAAIFATGWAVTVAGFATGALPPALLVALLPAWTLQTRQLVEGLGHERWLVARHLGWKAFNAGVLALVVVNLLAS